MASVLPVVMTFAPSFAKRKIITSPIPELSPVTIAAWLVKFVIFITRLFFIVEPSIKIEKCTLVISNSPKSYEEKDTAP